MLELVGTPEEILDHLHKLREQDRLTRARVFRSLMLAVGGFVLFFAALVHHPLGNNGLRIALSSWERLTMVVGVATLGLGALLAWWGERARIESRRLRLTVGALEFWRDSSQPSRLRLDLRPSHQLGSSFEHHWLHLSIGDELALDLCRHGSSWLGPRQRRYRYHELVELTFPGQGVPVVPGHPRFAAVTSAPGKVVITGQTCEGLNHRANLEAADLLGPIFAITKAD